MNSLPANPKIRARQFKSRQFKNRIQLFSGLIVIGVGFLAVFQFFNFINSDSSSCPTCSSFSKSSRNRRQADNNADNAANSNAQTADPTITPIGQQFQSEFETQLKNDTTNQNLDKASSDMSDEDYNTWLSGFYENFCVYFYSNSNIPEGFSFAEGGEKCSPDTVSAAIECNNFMKTTYKDTYQKNGINWCDSTAGWPNDMNIEDRRNGGVVLYFLGMFYMFVALAIVCDEYFVPALEVITDKLALSPDVAGATFMAAGGSAPELFTSIIGVFIADSNVGIGTIVGSAVFNILFVLGACAFIVGMKPDENGNPTVLNLTWFPLTRDTLFYVISLVTLILAFTKGGNPETVELWESIILFLIYFAYVTFMMFNAKIEAKFVKNKDNQDDKDNTEMDPLKEDQQKKEAKNNWLKAVAKVPTQTNFHTRQVLALTTTLQEANTRGDQIASYAVARFYALKKRPDPKLKNAPKPDSEAGADENADPELPDANNLPGTPYTLKCPNPSEDGWMSAITTILLWPLTIPLKFTVPDCRFKKINELMGGYIFVFSFTMSILWICVFSYLMVWWATRIGETYNIDSALMGLTFLAAGTSVPDLITSVIVAREGHGDMAVSSSIGSNIFDVTVGLPLPWILYSIVFGKGKAVSSNGLGCSIGLLLLMLVTLIGSILATGWKMNRTMGFMMLLLYVGFVAVSLCFEYNIWKCPF